MLKLNASFSKKVPAEQEYSSKGYSATIEVELPDGLNQEQLRQRIHETFQMVEASVESEISGSNVNLPQQAAPQATATIPIRQPAVNPRSQSSSKAPAAASARPWFSKSKDRVALSPKSSSANSGELTIRRVRAFP
jgi:hypothetical protein